MPPTSHTPFAMFPALVTGLDDLIAMKRACGRPIDRSNIIALTEPASG